MTSVRLILLVALFSGSAFSAGPAYRHKDPIISQEFENVYRDISGKIPSSHISPWTSYTPTWAASGTQPVINTGTLAGKWRRVGDTMELTIFMSVDGATTFGTGNYSFSLPSGYTIDTAKLPGGGDGHEILGTAHALDTGTAIYMAHVFYLTTSTIRMLQPTTGSAWGQTVPMTWATGDKMFLKFSAPISGWVAR